MSFCKYCVSTFESGVNEHGYALPIALSLNSSQCFTRNSFPHVACQAPCRDVECALKQPSLCRYVVEFNTSSLYCLPCFAVLNGFVLINFDISDPLWAKCWSALWSFGERKKKRRKQQSPSVTLLRCTLARIFREVQHFWQCSFNVKLLKKNHCYAFFRPLSLSAVFA